VNVSLSALHTRAIVLDIEGTTTPVEFVYQVLFPFARAHVADFLERERDSAPCREAVALLRDEQAAETDDVRSVRLPWPERSRRQPDLEPVLAYVNWLMDRDRKSRGLKALQGLIWQDGYRSGDLHGQVYPDVPPALARWQARGLATYIYSSGSVLAQQLIFGSTVFGDLTKFLHGYFDTQVGPKQSSDSYRRVADSIGVPPDQILFLSDVVAELDAARAAGLQTALCVRADADPGANASPHQVIHTFNEVVD
jgi:enolase-phosphatase E1